MLGGRLSDEAELIRQLAWWGLQRLNIKDQRCPAIREILAF